MLPVEAEPFLNYLRSIRELHFAVISKEFSYSRCEKAIFEFEIHFWHLHETMSLPMTLKVHIILDHYMWYFNEMGKNFCETNAMGNLWRLSTTLWMVMRTSTNLKWLETLGLMSTSEKPFKATHLSTLWELGLPTKLCPSRKKVPTHLSPDLINIT